MSSEKPRSATGLYRKHRELVESHSENLWKMLDERYPDKQQLAEVMFALSESENNELTPEEKKDVENFARYALKRLTVAEIVSPLHADVVNEDAPELALPSQSSPGLLEHDLIHAMVAYARTQGRSLAPAYTLVKEGEANEVEIDPQSLEEEIMVFLFQDKEARVFLEHLFKDGDPAKWYEDADMPAGFFAEIAKLKGLEEEDRLVYCQRIFDLYWLFKYKGENLPFDSVPRNPEFSNTFKAFYDNSQEENPDAKIALYEFQRILTPLLTRLRQQQTS